MSTQESPRVSMARATKIIRKSIHTFLQNYHYLTSIATFIALPFSISLLMSQALVPRSLTLLPTIYSRVESLFNAAGFPQPSIFFSIVAQKLSQTVSTWVLTLPFAISFLLLAKVSIIQLFTKSSNFTTIYNALLKTHICNSIVIFGVNATCFSIVFLAFNLFEQFQLDSLNWVLFLTIICAVLYSFLVANTLVICNLALISSGMETRKSPGFLAILRACLTIKGKTSTALALAVPVNLGLAGLEALFHFRIIKPHENVVQSDTQLWFVAFEGVLIAYLYSILLVLEVIMSCFFYQNCMNDSIRHDDYDSDLEIEDLWYYKDVDIEKLKVLEDFV
ncbi:hypothetical protein RND81_10G215100 [Saponaria officinalis]|uniref:Transmembrane protein n=1 Tax=Saponaria officinalis TaxID=3572 RepID=A0AAW1I561_SAPOF